MHNYTLDDLNQELGASTEREKLFQWCRTNGMLPLPNEAQARVALEHALNDDARKAIILGAYLPVYSTARNQRELRGGLVKSGVATGTGIVAIVLGLFVDSKAAKFFLEAAGTGSTMAGMVGTGLTYLRHG